MNVRVGKVTNVYPDTGKVKVLYEDSNNTSMPLSMLTMNNEYSMPAIGDRVLTVHMENGSSKGFVLGTYYGGGTQPKVSSGYRKDLGGGAYVSCQNGGYLLKASNVTIQADNITFACSDGTITVNDIIKRLDEIEGKLNSIE
jgi:phage baseplate assembly protein gpV